jgi:hypothetical protein
MFVDKHYFALEQYYEYPHYVDVNLSMYRYKTDLNVVKPCAHIRTTL